jgi:hypothetical protein
VQLPVRESSRDLVREVQGERGLADAGGPVDDGDHSGVACLGRFGDQPGERLERLGPAREMPCGSGQLPWRLVFPCGRRGALARGRRADRHRVGTIRWGQ